MITLVPNQSQYQTVLRSFLLSILPGVEVFEGQANRVPEPATQDFVVFTATSRDRIETNVDTYADVSFTGEIVGSVLNISDVAFGTIATAGQPTVYGTGVAFGTQIISQLSGTAGGIGTYLCNGSQSASIQQMAAGQTFFLQPTNVHIQLDVHGPAAADNTQIITTLYRDAFAFDYFAASGSDARPLHADDPKQIPFQNAESQYEDRYVIDANLQVNQVVGGIPTQFFNTVILQLHDVP
jgi:hypothetical protein